MSTSDWTQSEITNRLLEVIGRDILPLTRTGVAAGNKIFGAALVHKNTLQTVLAETNNELENPLWHGEMHCLKRYYEMPSASRPAVEDLIFLSTHEPCSLCLSAITWSGFDNFYYFFSHVDSRDAFAIPHDLKILKEVFDVDPGGYRRSNAFWQSHAIADLIGQLPAPDRHKATQTAQDLHRQYDLLSQSYQSRKHENDIPLN